MNMANRCLKGRADRLANKPLGELMELFGPRAELPDDFGNPSRKRLFSPRTDLLALSFPGTRRRRFVPGSPA